MFFLHIIVFVFPQQRKTKEAAPENCSFYLYKSIQKSIDLLCVLYEGLSFVKVSQ